MRLEIQTLMAPWRSHAVVAARVAVLAGLLAAGCSKPPVTEIGDGWMVDAGLPLKPAAHLYHEVKGTRVLVDRQIEAYRLYPNRCLMYEAPHPEGRFVFVVWGGLKPLAITSSDTLRPWRLDGDGLRRFDRPADPDGRTLLSVSLLKYGDICYNAQLQPPFEDPAAAGAPFRHMPVTPQETVLDVNGADSSGNSALSDAARDDQVTLVDELLRAGADVNSANHAGITVLMAAVAGAGRHTDVARRLIRGGARVNAQDDRGQTVLMEAARYRNLEMAQLLIEAGADGTIRDDTGRTAAFWVPDNSATDIRPLRDLMDRAAAPRK